MHELSVLKQMIRTIEHTCREQQIEKVETIVLQVGELSDFLPEFARDVFPMAVEGTFLEGAGLQMERVPALGRCRECRTEFHPSEHQFRCPVCASLRIELLSGREVFIKELIIEETEED